MARQHKYLSLTDIPEREPDKNGRLPDFWTTLESEESKHTIILLMINEVRRADPTNGTNEQCRSSLAKLRAYVELLDLPDYLVEQAKTTEEETD